MPPKGYKPPKDAAERKARHDKMVEIGRRNLIPVKPGEVRNPTGRPKRDESIASKLNKFGALPAPEALLRPIYEAFPDLDGKPLTIDDVTWINMTLAAAANSLSNIDFLNKKVEGDAVNINFNDTTPQRRIDPSKLKQDTKRIIRDAIAASRVGTDDGR